MTPLRQILIAVHVLAGLIVIAILCRHLGERAQEVNRVRVAAAQERAATVALESEMARVDQLRQGVERQDPYVIELLAREQLGWGRPGEHQPPPAQPVAAATTQPPATTSAPGAVDRPATSPTK